MGIGDLTRAFANQANILIGFLQNCQQLTISLHITNMLNVCAHFANSFGDDADALTVAISKLGAIMGFAM